MKLKLDENLGTRGLRELRDAGRDLATVCEQGLDGRADAEIHSVGCSEQRALVTLDAGFGNPLILDSQRSSGIVLLRFVRHATPAIFRITIETLIIALRTMSLTGKLWIIQDRQIRVYQPETAPDDLT